MKDLGLGYHEALEAAGHKLVRSENGEVDDWQLDVDDPEGFRGHNGPLCSKCGETWCIHCREKIEPCHATDSEPS